MTDTLKSGVPQPKLTLFQSTAIIVGVIIGSGIFESPPLIAASAAAGGHLPAWVWVMIVWALGGVISFLGALVYAELGTTYPKEGGDYYYLNRAYGDWSGFLFGWARLAVIQGASIGAIAYVFGDYATRLHAIQIGAGADANAGIYSGTIYAGAAVLVLTIINILGVTMGAWTQSILTVIKVLGLGIVFVVALLFPSQTAVEAAKPFAGFGLALILVLWTYGGWSEIVYVAAEVKDARRNIWRSIIYGLGLVTIIYLLINAAFLYSLGFAGLSASKAVAADVMAVHFGETGARLISALVVTSALGALNGYILTSPRVYYAMGTEHRLFAPLGYWSPRLGTPVVALIVQGVICIGLIAAFGSSEGFKSMVVLTAAAYWGFKVMVVLALFTLRVWDRDVERPYKVIGYPVVPFLFLVTCLYMFYASLDYAPKESGIGAIIILAGLPLYYLSVWKRRQSPE